MLFYLIIALVVLVSYGIIGSMFIMKLDTINSIYFTAITITTLGYGDIVPITALQKMFAVTLAIGGVGIFVYVFRLSILVAGERIEEIRSGAKMRRTINSLKDHYILCEYGRVGSVVVEELEKRNQAIVVIDKDREVTESLKEEKDILVIHGDATEERNLHKAGIDNAIGIRFGLFLEQVKKKMCNVSIIPELIKLYLQKKVVVLTSILQLFNQIL